MGKLPRKKTTWAMIICAGILGIVSILILAQPRARAALRLVGGFSVLDADPRIRFEPGAEEPARAVAAALPAAVTRVEECQAGAFEKPFRVYVCGTHGSFTRHIGERESSPVRGIAFPRDVWISPKAFSFHGEDTHRESLIHELSHLHLGQKLGWWHRTGEVPSWFQEGLADWAADTGDEQVSRREACEAILDGHRIELDESGHLPFPKRPESYGMAWPMFHMQSRMFLEYLRSRDVEAFERFVAAVMERRQFGAAFEGAFGESLQEGWDGFVRSMTEMNDHGVLVDISHLNDSQMAEVVRFSKAPVIASHSCVRAIARRDYNLSDEILQLLKEKRGYVFVSFNKNDLFREKEESTQAVERFADQVVYLRNTLEIDHIGIGSDYQADGIYVPDSLNETDSYRQIESALGREGFSHFEIRQIMHTNFIQMMKSAE